MSPTTVNSGGTLDIGGYSQTVSSLSGGGTVANTNPSISAPTPTLTNQGASSTFSGVIQDGADDIGPVKTSLTQNSPNNTLTLTGANTYTGGTTISAGTVQIGNGGTTGSIVGDATNNGTLAFDHSDHVDFAGVISGSGSLTQLGGGTLTLSGANTYTGGTTVSAGILSVSGSIGSASTPSGAINIASGGTLSTSGDSSIDIGSASITNAGLLDNDGAITAGALSNLVGASLVNKGVLTDDLNNSGTVVNYGTYTANIASNSGAITNNGLLGRISQQYGRHNHQQLGLVRISQQHRWYNQQYRNMVRIS